ncbi:MAG: restriction endonuclease [Chloroflexi bacterium]|nr:restriction endonuclease [Chloroflexota bacterium]
MLFARSILRRIARHFISNLDMPGHLFTQYFLTDGIRATPERRAQRQAFVAFSDAARRLTQDFAAVHNPNETQTEQDLIRPLLHLLGWTDDIPQPTAPGGEDRPDLLLFQDIRAKARATRSKASPYLEALALAELKSFHTPLDARGNGTGAQAASPHAQILRYLRGADNIPDCDLRWGILTNGAVWRLYDQTARPRTTGYYEADLKSLVEADDEDGLRTFHLLFRRSAFLRRPGANATFLDVALDQGKRYEDRVAQNLAGVVFDRVFPRLLQALADATDRPMPEIRDAALIFLYRLLFVLYAEDRGLLPVDERRYDDYGLRKRVRDDVARRKARNDTFSSAASSYFGHLVDLFGQIDRGDPSIGLPPYNGGLFADRDAAKLLKQVRLPDDVIADIVYHLSHTNTEGQPSYVNYRDMSVQQLGSIYERLLEQEPVLDAEGKVRIRPNPYARKDSGSFYTPQDLVDLIVDQTLKPLLDERRARFETTAQELRSDRRSTAERRDRLAKVDPAVASLDLKVLDPAMGSGHFLVSAVDALTDHIYDWLEPDPKLTDWLPKDDAYVSPLVKHVDGIRDDILQRAATAGWAVNQAQLTDQAIIRRLVLKRCIYGVDKNPLTVELAKVSLWLHSFTVGAPLSFLDHHLREGDSLLGLSIADARTDLRRLDTPLFVDSALQGFEAATERMHEIERRADADVSEVHESQLQFQDVESATAGLRGFLDALGGLRWLTAGMKLRQRARLEAPIAATLGADPSRAYEQLAHSPADHPNDGSVAFRERLTEARAVAAEESFLHWEVTFPGVWRRWQNQAPEGGFDAVIGNPPWDRIKLQEVEWFATRDPDLARAPTAAARREGIKRLREQGDPLAHAFDQAKARADRLGQAFRASDHYPLLGGGDINLYSLFVERSLCLVKPNGLVGLLTPSGIYADRTAARFFHSVSTTGRVAGIYDFENRKIFFKDIHASFKFCALIVGGTERRFPETRCAFFLHDTDTINDPDRALALSPDDFARVNPNTGTAPVFRTRRDADLTRRIYRDHPVLVDRSGDDERRVWPVRYVRMLDMTNDSHLFRTVAQLEDDGFYPVQGNRWKRGDDLYLPLYQGRMIQHFDHRASSVRINPESTHNPYLSEDTTDAQHSDPNFLPRSQYWVPASEVAPKFPKRGYALGFRDIARPTDVRTVISTVVPRAGYGNKVPLLLEDTQARDESGASESDACDLDASDLACLAANLNSMCFDFVARQKVQGTTLNLYILEQLPIIKPDAYNRRFGDRTAADLVRDHVLRLTYTAHDMAAFARDLGHHGPPFPWDEEERRHLRARLDACYFHLYGLTRDDASYILATFPIIQRQDEAEFDGRYRTRDLILAYMNALAAGDSDAVVNV